MKISCAIIEDEPLALERTRNYVEKISYLDLKATFNNALEAMSYLKDNELDLIFLDIEMDELTGIELLQSIANPPHVILTTAYEKYALQGYELNVDDYLLKPFTFNRFLKAVETVSQRIMPKDTSVSEDAIFLKSAYKIERIALNDILYIEGMRDYRNVQTPEKKILVLQTFGDFEKTLPAKKFCRVHKSYIVSISKIDFIERKSIQIGKKRIPISDTYKDAFFQLIGFNE